MHVQSPQRQALEVAMTKSYMGMGDASSEASFVCVVDTNDNNPIPAPEYLQ
jgi:hypothetical protein